MKNQIVTRGIVLTRTNFQEADRIITLLTPDHGKVKVMAKGVRRTKSKLAGGIELFSISNITFIKGRGDISTLISTRLLTYYRNIVKDINRTMLGYELLKRINRITEDAAGEEYFHLLSDALIALDDYGLTQDMLELWFSMQLLKITGHTPNLNSDSSGNKLDTLDSYLFDFEDMAFVLREDAPYQANHVKLLRLAIGLTEPTGLKQVHESEKYLPEALQLAKTMLSRFVRV